MNKEISLVGLWNASNYGDPVLGFCAKKLLFESISCKNNIKLVEVNLKPSFKIPLIKHIKEAVHYRLAKVFGNEASVGFKICANRLYGFYKDQLRNSDAIIFVGGGIIKYRKIEPFDCAIDSIVKIAQIKKIPTVMSSVGVEGFDLNDEGCQRLKACLNHPSLKYISTRDDLLTLTNDYFEGNALIPCELVADPAVWASECYNIQRDLSSKTIGIGIARGGIFSDYDKDFSSEKLMRFYIDLIHLVMNNGFKVELFTNGMKSDNDFLKQIMVHLSDAYISLKIPNSARDLVQTIASYKAIVATRMHAGIIAYSLNVPAIGLAWNNKIKFFWANAGHPENCIDVDNMTPENVAEALKNTLKKGYNQEHRQKYRQTIKDGMRKIASILV